MNGRSDLRSSGAGSGLLGSHLGAGEERSPSRGQGNRKGAMKAKKWVLLAMVLVGALALTPGISAKDKPRRPRGAADAGVARYIDGK
jgi:hypothetical protein